MSKANDANEADHAPAPDWPALCHRCGATLTPGNGSFYVVRIEAFCDPSPPPDPGAEPLTALAGEIDELLDELRLLSERELMDQVYRRLTISLCRSCYVTWIDDPTAAPSSPDGG